MATTPTHAPLRTMYPNDGSVSKPIIMTISDKSLQSLQRIMAGKSIAPSGGGGGGGSSDADNQSNTKSMVKSLLGIGAMVMILRRMEANSQVLNAYQSAMGKVFGAAMDMLLMPFMPLFNLMMVALTKLISWLISSGVLKKIQTVMEQVAKNLESIGKFFLSLFKAIIHGEWGEAAHIIVKGFKDAIASIFSGKVGAAAAALAPSAALGLGGFMLGGPSLALKGAMLPFMLGGKVLGKVGGAAGGWAWSKTGGALWNKFGWGGGGGTPPIVPPPGAGGAGGGVGAGGIGMGALMKAGGYALAGQVAGMGIEYIAGKMGYDKNSKGVSTLSYAAKGAGLGAAVGTLVPVLGTGIGAAVGGIAGGLYGYFKGGREQQQQQQQQQGSMAGDIINSNNKNSNNTINVYMTVASNNPNQAAGEFINAVEKKTGYQIKSGGGTFAGVPLPSRNTPVWRNLLVDLSPVPGSRIVARAAGFI